MALTALSAGATEGDVEAQIVLPILTRAEYLGISLEQIKSKEFLAAFDIGKGAKTKKGYIPDFCVYALSLPILVVEVKAPAVPVSTAWDEASLYAHVLNKRFPTKINPCEIIFVTNGLEFGAGRWDSATPAISGPIASLAIGSILLEQMQSLMSGAEIARLGSHASASLTMAGFRRPSAQGAGPGSCSTSPTSWRERGYAQSGLT